MALVHGFLAIFLEALCTRSFFLIQTFSMHLKALTHGRFDHTDCVFPDFSFSVYILWQSTTTILLAVASRTSHERGEILFAPSFHPPYIDHSRPSPLSSAQWPFDTVHPGQEHNHHHGDWTCIHTAIPSRDRHTPPPPSHAQRLHNSPPLDHAWRLHFTETRTRHWLRAALAPRRR